MKKRIIAMVLTVVLVLSMTTMVFAEPTGVIAPVSEPTGAVAPFAEPPGPVAPVSSPVMPIPVL